jgi:hypothetical protein
MRKKKAPAKKGKQEEEVSIETQVARVLYLGAAECLSILIRTLETASEMIEKSGSKIAK